MEGELWKALYRIVTEVGKNIHSRCVQFSDQRIVLVFFWAVIHQRPIAWACRDDSWPRDIGPLPSAPTMSRRLRTSAVQRVLNELERRCNRPLPRSHLRCLDGKPLVIGPAGGDVDAGWGPGACGTRAKGYKLHAIWDSGGALEAWQVQPLNVQEKVVAYTLIERLSDGGYLLADNNYDSNALYEQAGAHHHQLLTPRRRHTRLGHQRHSVHRLHAARMLEDGLNFFLKRQRRMIERQFGSLGNWTGGLGPLPNWVRRLGRVRRWVQGKLILNALRILQNKRLIAMLK